MKRKAVRILLVILLLLSTACAGLGFAFAAHIVKQSTPERVVYDGHEVIFTRESDKRKSALFGTYSVVYKGYVGESPVSLTVKYTKEEYAALTSDAKLTGYAYYIIAYPAEYYLTFDHMAEPSEIDQTLQLQQTKLAIRMAVPGVVFLFIAVALLVLLIKGKKPKAETTAPTVTAEPHKPAE